jgi:hypothetical protein
VERSAVLAKPLDVEGQGLLGVSGRVLDVLALGVQAGEVGGVDVVAALLNRLEDEFDLTRLGHRVKVGTRRNRVRTRVLYGAIERANVLLAQDCRPPLPEGITFHALRRTYAALRAELGEHPAITAAQMGHRDPRMTLRVYTDVAGLSPRTRLGGLLGDDEWAPMGTRDDFENLEGTDETPAQGPRTAMAAGIR